MRREKVKPQISILNYMTAFTFKYFKLALF